MYTLFPGFRPGIFDTQFSRTTRTQRNLYLYFNFMLYVFLSAQIDSSPPHRNMVLRIQDDGTIVDEPLRREVESIRGISIDDSVNESPHSRVNRIGSHARRAGGPWIASTFRLNPNLSNIVGLAEGTGESVNHVWLRYKDAVPSKKRLHRRDFERRLYSIWANVDDHVRRQEGHGGGDGSSDGDASDPPPSPRA